MEDDEFGGFEEAEPVSPRIATPSSNFFPDGRLNQWAAPNPDLTTITQPPDLINSPETFPQCLEIPGGHDLIRDISRISGGENHPNYSGSGLLGLDSIAANLDCEETDALELQKFREDSDVVDRILDGRMQSCDLISTGLRSNVSIGSHLPEVCSTTINPPLLQQSLPREVDFLPTTHSSTGTSNPISFDVFNKKSNNTTAPVDWQEYQCNSSNPDVEIPSHFDNGALSTDSKRILGPSQYCNRSLDSSSESFGAEPDKMIQEVSVIGKGLPHCDDTDIKGAAISQGSPKLCVSSSDRPFQSEIKPVSEGMSQTQPDDASSPKSTEFIIAETNTLRHLDSSIESERKSKNTDVTASACVEKPYKTPALSNMTHPASDWSSQDKKELDWLANGDLSAKIHDKEIQLSNESNASFISKDRKLEDQFEKELCEMKTRYEEVEHLLRSCQADLLSQKKKYAELQAKHSEELTSIREAGHTAVSIVVEQQKVSTQLALAEQHENFQQHMTDIVHQLHDETRSLLQHQKEKYEVQLDEELKRQDELWKTRSQFLFEEIKADFSDQLVEYRDSQERTTQATIDRLKNESIELLNATLSTERRENSALWEKEREKADECLKKHQLSVDQKVKRTLQECTIEHEKIMREALEAERKSRKNLENTTLDIVREEVNNSMQDHDARRRAVLSHQLTSLDIFLESARKQLDQIISPEEGEFPSAQSPGDIT